MKNILLIEDNDLIRESTAEILELTGYQVQTAENGKVGVEKALSQKPDLVICDIMMPVLDGYGVLHIFNTNPKLTGVPFIFLTAKTESADFRKSMELGADDYLTKPFNETQLLRAIEGRLNRFANISSTNPPSESTSKLLFSIQETSSLQSLTMNRKVHFIRKKRSIYTEGNKPTQLYFLKSGQVKTLRSNADQKEFITELYKPGDFFGYAALIGDWQYTDTAETIEDSEVIFIPQADFFQELSANRQTNWQFIKMLLGRVEEREHQLLGMAYHSLRKRVADKLIELHRKQPNGIISFSRDDLAALVGTATESLIRILSEFKQDGTIETLSTGSIKIVRPDKLQLGGW